MKQLRPSILLSILLAGCATTSGYEAMWVGDSADHLVSVWGPPQQEYRQSAGGRVLEYQRSGQVVLPGVTTYQPQTTYTSGTISAVGSTGNYVNGSYGGTTTTFVPHISAPTVISKQCVTRFTADPSGRITSWAWQGNACRSVTPKKPTAPAPTATPAYQKCTADQLRRNECA
jgi:hypothetical protein